MRIQLQKPNKPPFRWWMIPIHLIRFVFRLLWVTFRQIRRFYRHLPDNRKAQINRYAPTWILLIVVTIILAPTVIHAVRWDIPRWVNRYLYPGDIAPLFTSQVQYWETDIVRWSEPYGLDPNMLATVMQIESCGHPTVSSHAGAQGLFQVMPFHFDTGEDMLSPDTNAFRGANFLVECSGYAGGDIGLTFACYNGGPGTIRKAFANWPHETQRYYYWALGIYEDATRASHTSGRLNEWLNAGGVNLCQRASNELGIP